MYKIIYDTSDCCYIVKTNMLGYFDLETEAEEVDCYDAYFDRCAIFICVSYTQLNNVVEFLNDYSLTYFNRNAICINK
ncbi:MAG: hypothetical protein MJ126_05780 [Lachnospiraceae bacterium]|nr:hypothetical protein [Lachnospiraceae bacterium]